MWNFKVIEPGIPERNPRETEFFRITSPAEAIVREFIQNSLDAKLDKTIKVKIAFNTVTRKDISAFLNDDLKRHLIACDLLENGVYPLYISLLILEDFGTTGLDGSIGPTAGNGNFYNFWWREGISQKTEQKAGRWGLGKITFHIISKIRTFFGLTHREDGKTLLMGKCLLKTHFFNNQRYHYFGYFSKDNFMPIDDYLTISEFKNKLGISRDREKGLSLVIPLPIEEIDFDSILRGVIIHYYYPIIAGKLIVELWDDNRNEYLNDENIIDKVGFIDWSNTIWADINIVEILNFIKSSFEKNLFELHIPNPDNPEINEFSFLGQLDMLKQEFYNGIPCKFKIPLEIATTSGRQNKTSFTVIIKKLPKLNKAFEGYVRSGILISEIKMLGARPVAALLIAEDQPICEFLGDCETPAHTDWNERTEGFRNKYINAARILRFIKKSLIRIVTMLDEPPAELQIDFLKEIFSISIRPEEVDQEVETTRPPIIPTIPRHPPLFNISPFQSGFKITLNQQSSNLSFPIFAIIRVAYDTFRGNPFNQYDKFDFDLGSNSIEILSHDCQILVRNLNKIEIAISGNNFYLVVSGFDSKRDIVVDIVKKEIANETKI